PAGRDIAGPRGTAGNVTRWYRERYTRSMDDETTTVRVGTTIDGDLRGDEDVRIEGRIHGSIDVAGMVVVERTGVVRGDVRAPSILVSGICIGSIEAAEKVVILESARVIGDVAAPTIEVDPGATFHSRGDAGALRPAPEDGEAVRPVLSGENETRA